METMERNALLLKLIDKIVEIDGNTNEAYLQKYVYILQELMEVPLNFEYILYLNSPYSFYLPESLTSMQADELLSIEINRCTRPSYVSTEWGKRFQTRYPTTMSKYASEIDFVVQYLCSHKIRLLGHVATTLFLERFKRNFSGPSDKLSLELNKLMRATWNEPDEQARERFAYISSEWTGEPYSFA